MKTEDVILQQIKHYGFVSFTKDDSDDRTQAINRLSAYGLVSDNPKDNWRLTEKGYEAVDAGFDKWLRKNNQKGLIPWLKNFWWYALIPFMIGIILLLIEQGWFCK